MDVLEVFDNLDYNYFNITDETTESEEVDYLGVREMTELEMMIETRPSYPSNKWTFTIARLTKGITIRFFNINLFNLKERFDVDVALEDSQRYFLLSVILLLISCTDEGFQHPRYMLYMF